MHVSSLLSRITAFLAVLLLSLQIAAQQLPASLPSSQGFSAELLSRMDAVIQASIEKKELPGAVVLVGRHLTIEVHGVGPFGKVFVIQTCGA